MFLKANFKLRFQTMTMCSMTMNSEDLSGFIHVVSRAALIDSAVILVFNKEACLSMIVTMLMYHCLEKFLLSISCSWICYVISSGVIVWYIRGHTFWSLGRLTDLFVPEYATLWSHKNSLYRNSGGSNFIGWPMTGIPLSFSA